MLSLYQIELPLVQSTKTASMMIDSRPTILCGYHVDNFIYWAEAPGFLTSDYMPETHDLLWQRLQEIAPTLLQSLQNQSSLLFHNEPILSYVCDSLLCQVKAAKNGQSLRQYFGCESRSVSGSAMIGILDTLSAYEIKLNDILKQGYESIKLKIDPVSFSIVLSVIQLFSGQFKQISVDANGSFSYNAAVKLLVELPENVIIEQPLNQLDDDRLGNLLRVLPNRIVLDESIRTLDDLDRFSNYNIGVMLKPVCCGGPTAFIEMVNRCRELGMDCGISGYLESGVGRFMHYILAQLPMLTLSPDFVWSNYYFTSDVFSILPGFNDQKMILNFDNVNIINQIHY